MHTHHDASVHDHGHANHSHGSVQLYVSVALALLVLTFCSYLTYTPLWPFGESVAIKRMWMMAVSCTKAMLVIMFFMHLKWEANWKWVLTIPASLMSLFLVVVLVPDVGLRMRHASPERLKHAAEVSATTSAGPGRGHAPANAAGRDSTGHESAGHGSAGLRQQQGGAER